MKTELTTEQSQHLLELGVPRERMTKLVEHRGLIPIVERTFSLTDLLEILPKEIDNRRDLQIGWHSLADKWFVGYEYCQSYHAEELIDALYELLCWVIKNGFLKFD